MCNRWLQQNEISARLSRIKRDNGTTLSSERQAFRLSFQIAQSPTIKQRSGAAARRKIIEPHNCRGFVTEQVNAAVRTYFEVTEVGASFC
ncbi:hypothetical protein CQ12_21040 [Bradyrhizobium jicamae]|uniref:Uncharacterized protein n=1 Tax=Bradyrhizobium jicamae TaxID=280332 RepID=A0A0R3KHA8_9BRAD|nr:hypothetical protein CQ12_21040 [Bradyrhizobium jicamae]